MRLLLTTILLGNLVVAGTAPTMAAPGGCDSGMLEPLLVPTVTMVLLYFGPSAGVKFAIVHPGQPFIFVENVIPGRYVIQSWAKNGKVNGCDTTIVKEVGADPTVVTN